MADSTRERATLGRRQSPTEEKLRAENTSLRAELERLRALYETPLGPPTRTKKAPPEPAPEQFALVGPGARERDQPGPSDEALDSVGQLLCQMLEERKPGTQWHYYRNQLLVPEGVTFFYAHDALRKMWGESPGNPEPPIPHAYRRLTAPEKDERDTAFSAALRRVDDALEQSQQLHAEGNVIAAGGLLKYVDLLLARLNLALAQSKAGDSQWKETLNDRERDAEFEAWLAEQTGAA